MKVNTIHQLYTEFKPRWELCADTVAGPHVMSAKADKYLMSLCDGIDSDTAERRNKRYQKLARYSGFPGSTVAGFVGLAFYRMPEVKVPAALMELLDDIDGTGVNLEQQAKGNLSEALTKGRFGLWTDYPMGAGQLSRAEQAELYIRPVILAFHPEQVINWRASRVGGISKLSLVVIVEPYIKEDDGFEAKWGEQYRCLRLIDGVYVVEVYRTDERGQFVIVPELSGTPTDGYGNAWGEIPFTFCGPENNSANPDAPAIEEISHLAVGHFRNSADAEISSFEMRPTVAVKMKEAWFKSVLKGQINMGGAIPLDIDGDIQIVQSDPNDLAIKLKDDKKADMIALCARIIEPERTQRTATEAVGDQIQYTSRLSCAADNLSAAYTKALKWCCRYLGIAEDCVYQLDTNYSTNRMTAQERQQLMAEWLAGAVTDADYHRVMQSDGVISESFDDWQAAKDSK